LISSACGKAGAMLKAYLACLAKVDIPLNRPLPLSEYAKRAVSLSQQKFDHVCTQHSDCAVTTGKDLKHEVTNALLKAYAEAKGCCLDCVRKTVCGEKTVNCRLGHAPTTASVAVPSPPT